MIKNLKDKTTDIHENTFIAESADVLGNVIMEEGSSIWYGAVARGDISYIKIGKYSNVQDNATLHTDKHNPVDIGNYVTIGHNAVVHGCTIGDNCLIGMGAIVLNGAKIGENSIIAAGTVVTENAIIPPNSLVMGIPGKVRRQLTEEAIKGTKENAILYKELWQDKYK